MVLEYLIDRYAAQALLEIDRSRDRARGYSFGAICVAINTPGCERRLLKAALAAPDAYEAHTFVNAAEFPTRTRYPDRPPQRALGRGSAPGARDRTETDDGVFTRNGRLPPCDARTGLFGAGSGLPRGDGPRSRCRTRARGAAGARLDACLRSASVSRSMSASLPRRRPYGRRPDGSCSRSGTRSRRRTRPAPLSPCRCRRSSRPRPATASDSVKRTHPGAE